MVGNPKSSSGEVCFFGCSCLYDMITSGNVQDLILDYGMDRQKQSGKSGTPSKPDKSCSGKSGKPSQPVGLSVGNPKSRSFEICFFGCSCLYNKLISGTVAYSILNYETDTQKQLEMDIATTRGQFSENWPLKQHWFLFPKILPIFLPYLFKNYGINCKVFS